MQDYIARTIDINEPIQDICVKQFDGNSRAIHVQILDKSLGKDFPMLLGGCRARMYVDTGTAPGVLVDGDVADGDNGIVIFIIPGSLTQEAGDYPCEIRLTDTADRSLISTKPFTLHVEESIFNDEGFEGSEELSALQQALNMVDAKIAEVETLKRQMNGIFVTPEMFGAVGDGIADDTIPLQEALNDGRVVVGKGNYKITSSIFINNEYKAQANSKIILDFNGDFGVVIGGSETEYDNTQYNFDVDIIIDCNNKTFSTACVALNAIKRSNIKLRGINCATTFYKDVYGNNGSNYENFIDINAIGTNTAGSICAKLQSSDNTYNEIIARDFETCIMLNTSSTQTVYIIHAWLSATTIWENSTVVAVEDVEDNYVVPRLTFNFLYQDSMRYGFKVNKIEAFGGFWFSAINGGIITQSVRESYPVVNFYGYSTDTPSFVRCDFHEFWSNRMTVNDERTLIFNGEINLHRSGYIYQDANDVPIGNRTVSISGSATNAPEVSTSEINIIQSTSLRQVVQTAIVKNGNVYVRHRGTWELTWSAWKQIGNPDVATSTFTSTQTIGSVNRCVKFNKVITADVVITTGEVAKNTQLLTIPVGFAPYNNFHSVCFGLPSGAFLEWCTDGAVYYRGTTMESGTILRIHEMYLTS